MHNSSLRLFYFLPSPFNTFLFKSGTHMPARQLCSLCPYLPQLLHSAQGHRLPWSGRWHTPHIGPLVAPCPCPSRGPSPFVLLPSVDPSSIAVVILRASIR